jgi:GT2 family glycosyltransferase
MRLSIIVVTYKRPELLRQTVAGLLPQLGGDAEILVVDQCAEAGEGQVFAGMEAVRYQNLPFANMVKARNQGIADARGEIILFVDDDVIPGPDLIRCHLEAYSDPMVGGVAGRIFEGLGPFAERLDTRALDEAMGFWYTHFDHAERSFLQTARGCNMSFRRDLLVAIGGFDRHFHCFRDDSDVCFSVRRLGYHILFCPEASLVHLAIARGGTREMPALQGLIRDEYQRYRWAFRHYRDNLYFLCKHFSGRALAKSLFRSYRDYVGLSRWPWRLAAKNVCFGLALAQAAWWAWRPVPSPTLEPAVAKA